MTQPQSDDDGVPMLTGATAAALREFLAEAEQAKARAAASGDDDGVEALFSEDWGLSQFWYTDETAERVAGAVIKAAQARMELVCDDEAEAGRGGGESPGEGGAAAPPSASSRKPAPRRRLPRIACVACPSLFRALRSSPEFLEAADAHLFEFDDRFAKLGGGFSHYDYRRPRAIDAALLGAFDAVVADPPYLSAECLKKTSVSMRLLGEKGGGGIVGGGGGVGVVGEKEEEEEEKEKKEEEEEKKEEKAGDSSVGGANKGNLGSTSPSPIFVLLSGAVQRHRASAYLNLLPVKWRPQHRNKLGNEFLLMTASEAVARELGGFDEELPIDPVEDEGESDEEDDADAEE